MSNSNPVQNLANVQDNQRHSSVNKVSEQSHSIDSQNIKQVPNSPTNDSKHEETHVFSISPNRSSDDIPEKKMHSHVDIAKLEHGESIIESTGQGSVDSSKKFGISQVRIFFKRHRWIIHLFWGLFFTAWWISIVAQPKHQHQWLIPTVLWIFIMIRLITFYTPTRYILIWLGKFWNYTVVHVVNYIPEKYRVLAGAAGTVAVMLVGTFASPEYPGSKRSERAVSFFGCCVAIFGLWATSHNRKVIKWKTVVIGMLIQFIVALFVLRTKCGYDIFSFISMLCRRLLGFAANG